MKAQQLHHKPVPHAFFNSVEPENFARLHMSGRVMKEDSCWEECESEYAEESIPSYLLTFIDDAE